MSQYRKPHPENPNHILTYGYDRPLTEYFYSIYDREKQEYFEASSSSLGLSNSQFLEKLEAFQVPEEHRTMVALDLPF